jgi:hypothetical protein
VRVEGSGRRVRKVRGGFGAGAGADRSVFVREGGGIMIGIVDVDVDEEVVPKKSAVSDRGCLLA